jgi:ATP-dependent exoDNAse (exonuclease V) beta subunit
MLIINGYVSQSRSGKPNWRGWLGQLAEISGLSADDLAGYAEQGKRQHTVDLLLGETAARATFYEPQYRPLPAEPLPGAAEEKIALAKMSGLQEPLTATPDDAAEGQTTDDEQERQVWRVIPPARRPRAPAWLIGVLVHEALALWRFPGDGFDPWAAARAKARGLHDLRQLQHAQNRTRWLLGRFQASDLFQEIDQAGKRFHELPYTYQQDGQVTSGRIDLLYLAGGQWTVVDFKTDRVKNEAELNKMRDLKGYDEQLRQYGTAVSQLLGQRPRLILCLLDYNGQVQTRVVPPRR